MARLGIHWRKSIPTNYRLWGIISAALFSAAASVNWFPHQLAASYWWWCLGLLAWLFRGGPFSGESPALLIFVIWGLVMAIPSIAFGWVLHAMALLIKQQFSVRADAVNPPAPNSRPLV